MSGTDLLVLEAEPDVSQSVRKTTQAWEGAGGSAGLLEGPGGRGWQDRVGEGWLVVGAWSSGGRLPRGNGLGG